MFVFFSLWLSNYLNARQWGTLICRSRTPTPACSIRADSHNIHYIQIVNFINQHDIAFLLFYVLNETQYTLLHSLMFKFNLCLMDFLKYFLWSNFFNASLCITGSSRALQQDSFPLISKLCYPYFPGGMQRQALMASVAAEKIRKYVFLAVCL